MPKGKIKLYNNAQDKRGSAKRLGKGLLIAGASLLAAAAAAKFAEKKLSPDIRID